MSDASGDSPRRLGGRFALQQESGSGGMATVYLGRDEVLDRAVAVKVLKHGFDADIAERFQREGRTAASLSHPNIVQVFDAGEAEFEGRNAPYIVMEYVPGGDLKGLIDPEGHLSSERVAELGSGISAGLAHAHERGVIHRDIKPHNVLLDEAGAPKLTDFGIARALDATTMTVSGVYLGTALYSSPEQLRGEEITPKSDVYSLGVALYEAASGAPPFSGTPLEVANQHTIREPESPSARRYSGVPAPELDALILSCLDKDPAKRPTAAEARNRLSSLSAGYRGPDTVKSSVPAGRAPRKRQTRKARQRGEQGGRKPVLRTFAGAVALVLLLVAGAAFAMMGGGLVQSPTTSPPTGSSGGPGAGVGVQDGLSSSKPSNNSSNQASGASQETADKVVQGGGAAGGSGAADAKAAAQTVSDVYQLAAAGNYGGSYDLLSSGFRQREVGSQQRWAATFDTLESISFVQGPTATVSGDKARVTGTTRAVHTDRTDFNRGTWTLVREGGEWRLDGLSIQKL